MHEDTAHFALADNCDLLGGYGQSPPQGGQFEGDPAAPARVEAPDSPARPLAPLSPLTGKDETQRIPRKYALLAVLLHLLLVGAIVADARFELCLFFTSAADSRPTLCVGTMMLGSASQEGAQGTGMAEGGSQPGLAPDARPVATPDAQPDAGAETVKTASKPEPAPANAVAEAPPAKDRPKAPPVKQRSESPHPVKEKRRVTPPAKQQKTTAAKGENNKKTRPESAQSKKSGAAHNAGPSHTADSAAATGPGKLVGNATGKGQGTGTGPGTGKGASGKAGQGTAANGKGTGAGGPVAFGKKGGPSFKSFVRPEYPAQARRQGIQGTVLLRLRISAAGRAENVEVVKSPSPVLSKAAREAVLRSTFNPLRQNGAPVACQTLLPIAFNLQ